MSKKGHYFSHKVWLEIMVFGLIITDLFGWAFYIPEATEDATISFFGFDGLTAARAFVEKLASVQRHFFLFFGVTVGTGEGGG